MRHVERLCGGVYGNIKQLSQTFSDFIEKIFLNSDFDFYFDSPERHVAVSLPTYKPMLSWSNPHHIHHGRNNRANALCVFMCVSLLDLEFVLLDDAAWLQVLADLVKNSQHGDVGLAGASWSADQKVFVGVIGRLKDNGLDPVQTLHPLEHQLPDLREENEGRTEWIRVNSWLSNYIVKKSAWFQ